MLLYTKTSGFRSTNEVPEGRGSRPTPQRSRSTWVPAHVEDPRPRLVLWCLRVCRSRLVPMVDALEDPVARLRDELVFRRAASHTRLTLERHEGRSTSVVVEMNPIHHILSLRISPSLLDRPEDLEHEVLEAVNNAVDAVRKAYPDGPPRPFGWDIPLIEPF